MNDIVDRLRVLADTEPRTRSSPGTAMRYAADEIEVLRGRVQRYERMIARRDRTDMKELVEMIEQLTAENNRLLRIIQRGES